MAKSRFSGRNCFTLLMITGATALTPLVLTAGTQSTTQNRIGTPLRFPAVELPLSSRDPLTAIGIRRQPVQLAQDSKDDDGNGGTPPKQPNVALIPGGPDEVVYNFCTAMQDDDTATASDYVSPNARGLLGQLRDGDLPEEKIEELVSFMKQPGNWQVREKANSTKRTWRNRNQSSMTFTLKKEKDVIRIIDLAFTKPKRTS